ncbi:PTS sugar transporter subunit IIA [Sphingomonas sp. RHCKR47]|uniref:PTS sugar transporter subunit IIA n=1 Tax=Sphingomonas citricola TaxID=2862498 RepID=UPI001CA4C45E|nr:PTS sugar transporter subunit IIA [Sphingomonas citricola]MBW6524254.1 PTS sugar transporter subunit IIA [Sphingomonas citricola]
MDLSDLLLPELVAVDVSAAIRKAVFTQIGALAAPVLGFDARVIGDALAAREKLGSTAFGGGVAIPHARIDGLDRLVAGTVRLAQPIDFGAVDDAPVDLLFVLLSPPKAGADHLKALARIARRVRDRALVAKLRGAGSRDAIWALLTSDETRDAA